MKTKREIIDGAIDLEASRNKDYPPGTIVGVKDYKYALTLIRYDGMNAIVNCKHKGEMSFLRSQIVDVKRVSNMAQHYMCLGFYPPDGIECLIIELGERDNDEPGL